MSTTATVYGFHEKRLIEAAKRGDETAFGKLIEPLRGELNAHCYRMLASLHDAEDAMQETWLRAWRSIGKFEGRSSFRSWMYRIATNVSLDLLAGRKRRLLAREYGPSTNATPGPGQPITESVWIEPFSAEELAVEDDQAGPDARYEQREGIELAFIASLQHLPAKQRAALILREVLGFSANEVAEILDTSTASVNSALQRARKAVEEQLPERSQQETLRALGDEGVRQIVESYMKAWEAGDVECVISMLAEDAALTMPPMATWYTGEDIRTFLTDWAFNGKVYDSEGARRVKVVPALVNGQIAFGTYSWVEEHEAHLPTVLQVLTLRGDRIEEITGFVMPDVFRKFGLPDELPA